MLTEESEIRLTELFVPTGTNRRKKCKKLKEQEPTKFQTSSGMVKS